MKYILGIIFLFSTIIFAADIKISELPLMNANGTHIGDSFPMVDTATGVTRRIKLYDLINLPTFLVTYAPIANPTFTGTVTAPTLHVTGTATISTMNATTGSIGTLTAGTINATAGSFANTVTAGTVNAIQLNSTNAKVTGMASSTDTARGIVYTDTSGNLEIDPPDLSWDDTNKRLGINLQGLAPSGFIDVHSDSTAVPSGVFNQTSANSSAGGGQVRLQSAPGAAMASGSRLGSFEFYGAKNSGNATAFGASIDSFTTQLWSATHNGSEIKFYTTPNDSTTKTLALTLGQDQKATFADSISAGTINSSVLTASQAVVTDSSKNLASLGYSSTNTASNIVQRDSSGNFSAGTITATLSGNATNVSGTVAIGNGGTGQTTQQTALNAIAGATTSGSYLRGNGTNVTMGTIQASDVPTLNQNTTGTAANITATSNSTLTTLSALSLPGSQVSGNISGNAANVTGTVAIGNGGTGQTTASAAFNALSPVTSTGDLIIGNGSNSSTRLPIGSNTYVLTSDGTTASWAAPSGGGGSSTFTATAGETLSAGQAVYIASAADTGRTTGRAYKLDASNSNRVEFSGIVTVGASAGSSATITVAGKVSSLSGLTAGQPVFASVTTPGGFQTSAPSTFGQYIIQVGIADSATSMIINGGLSSTAVLVTAAQTTYSDDVGSIHAFAVSSSNPPNGYLVADGSAVSRVIYANLFAKIGTTFGSGDGSTTFNLPNLQGIFIRGAGSQTIGGISYSGTLGTTQGDQFQDHGHLTHLGGTYGTNVDYVNFSATGSLGGWGLATTTNNLGASRLLANEITTNFANNAGTPRAGTQTYPANITLTYFIKYVRGSTGIVAQSDWVAPTIQKFTSGSGTYTLPTSPRVPKYLKIRMAGGGAGGNGGGGTQPSGGNGGNTTFGTSLLTANGGNAGSIYSGGAGGGSTVNSPAIAILQVNGTTGGGGAYALSNALGGLGGGNVLSPSVPTAVVAAAGSAGVAYGGGGSGGPSINGTASNGGGGGGAGGYLEAIINNPSSATYSYSIGTGGTAGAAGTSGFAGGAGAAGVIIVEEYYQ